jgi:predicted RNase H-like nuclease (RuvC/YqgF family)
MAISKPWDEMTVDEKLDTLRQDMKSHQRQSAATMKALDEICRRAEQIERRLMDLMLD